MHVQLPKLNPDKIFLQSCETKSRTENLGSRLAQEEITEEITDLSGMIAGKEARLS